MERMKFQYIVSAFYQIRSSSFTLTLDTAITKEIGITSVNQVLEILQEDFDATHELLSSKFKKVSPSIFKALEPANAYIGSNTGFVQKTIIMAAFTDNEETGIDIIRAILDVNFKRLSMLARIILWHLVQSN